jgi:hypothetical protein
MLCEQTKTAEDGVLAEYLRFSCRITGTITVYGCFGQK